LYLSGIDGDILGAVIYVKQHILSATYFEIKHILGAFYFDINNYSNSTIKNY
jgi:hypothetical protein